MSSRLLEVRLLLASSDVSGRRGSNETSGSDSGVWLSRVKIRLSWPHSDMQNTIFLITWTRLRRGYICNTHYFARRMHRFGMHILDQVSVESCALLGRYATQIGSLLPTFRDNLSVPSSRPSLEDPWRWDHGGSLITRSACWHVWYG